MFLPCMRAPGGEARGGAGAQGHSLGGSLATLLLVMYLRRGVLPAVATSPTYTFGAPAVFCEGGCSGHDACCPPDTDGSEVPSALFYSVAPPPPLPEPTRPWYPTATINHTVSARQLF